MRFSIRSGFVLLALSVLFPVAVAATVGCSPVHDEVQGAQLAVTPNAPVTVAVQRKDMASVLVLDGAVQSRPVYVISAPATGAMAFADDVAVGASVMKGQTVGTVDDIPVTAVEAGVVSELLAEPGAQVSAKVPLLTVKYGGFGLLAQVPVDKLYRLYSAPVSARASIQYGPAGLGCALTPAAADQVAVPDGGSDGGVGPEFLCLLPADADVVPGLFGSVGIALDKKPGILTLPATAVRGSSQKGVVSKIDGGSTTLVDVQLGISDGVDVEVTGGLKEGDTVSNQAPGLINDAAH
ncbi:efflux RND transporter periplasmic adaptor subunit [Arthrobacter stackebrandtii]|nr:efflux RND transporter periplasmic adaptor subunit [Arthrobacter stackebrandtii]PYG99843.1 hypothetical protein CVV67_12760 [Arthrobacter stackebrandtii]